MSSERAEDLVVQLGSFSALERRRALEGLVRAADAKVLTRRRPEVNLHCHTLFSYNAYGYSPSRFAWEAARYGLEAAGIVDFDVLDGTREFLEAGKLLRLKTVAGFETRVFIEELRDRVTNSPHEPGVSYFITTGFTAPPEQGTSAARTLASMAECAQRRNRTMLDRANAHLEPVAVDYERDVLPLTPAGNATERHMLIAYERRAQEVFRDEPRLVDFWSAKLSEPKASVKRLLADPVALRSLMRTRLMKHGGVGYAAPEQGSFPRLEAVVQMTLDCGAIPSGGWLDGMNNGEADPVELFRFWLGKGIPTVTIIPDRNWNVSDPEQKAIRVSKLEEAVRAAVDLQMPILVGTEMNADGQKFVDTFSAPEMEPHREAFLDGAHFAWGHTFLKGAVGVGCTGRWAEQHFGDDAARRNEFFRRVGAGPYLEAETFRRLADQGPDAPPEALLRALSH